MDEPIVSAQASLLLAGSAAELLCANASLWWPLIVTCSGRRPQSVAPNSDAENTGQRVQAIFHPLPPMLEGLTSEAILATQKRPPHTARHAVKGTGRSGRNENRAGVGHGSHHHRLAAARQSAKRQKPCRKILIHGCPVLLTSSVADASRQAPVLRQSSWPTRLRCNAALVLK